MIQRAKWTSLSLLLALLLGACGEAVLPGEVGPGLVKNEAGYIDISADQLAGMLEDTDLVLVNVHIPYEGEIPDTDLFIPFGEMQDHLEALPDKDAPIVLYCRSGGMSATAAEVLVEHGYRNVMELDGGFNAWKAQGYELLDNQ